MRLSHTARASAALALTLTLGVGSLAACSTGAKESASDEKTIEITDQSKPERTVKMPHGAQHIATAVIPYPEVIAAVDEGSWGRIVGVNKTTLALNSGSIAKELFPESVETPVITTDGFDVDPEVVAKLGADAAVQWYYEDMQHLEDAGIPTIGLNYGTLEDLKGWISMTGKLLAKEERAEDMLSTMDKSKKDVENKVAKLGEDDVRALTVIAVEDSAFTAFSADKSYDAVNFEIAGANGVASGLADSNGSISAEELIKWNPEVIFISGLGKATPADVLNHPLLQDVEAVKTKRVYKTPTGIFPWQIPCAENYLMWYWTAAVLHPDLYDWDMRDMTREQMQYLFGKELTDEQIDAVLRMDMNSDSAGYADMFGNK